MKSIIISIELLFLVPTVYFAIYLAFLTLMALLRKPRRHLRTAKPSMRFAILVPAHDEEPVIENTLRSLSRIDYPDDRFDVIVIADNCADRTADISRTHGAVVYERFDQKNRGKGQALRWCLDQLANARVAYDAFVVIDADTVVSRNLLRVMNNYLESGAECVQCSTLVVSQPGVWSPEMTRIGFILHNYVRPLAKKALGLSMGLNGNGMCFSAKLTSRIPWAAYSRVEDLEHSLQLVLNGVKVQFAPEASVHAIMPTDSRDAESQRRRWEIARFSVIKKYSPVLLSTSMRTMSPVVFDMLIELVTPAFLNLFLFTIAAFAVNVVFVAAGADFLGLIALLYGAALLLDVFHVIGGLKAAGADRSTYRALMNTPKYAAWKMRLYFRALLNGDDKTWLRTERGNRLAPRD